MAIDAKLAAKYPFLNQYTSPVKKAEREIIGREKEMRQVLASLMRPELCNVMLLAEAGTGKTALVQGTMEKDSKRMYLEVDLSKMIAELNDVNEMATKLKTLFEESANYSKDEEQELVLFIDEFHQIVQLSAAAVEALKPLLADSGTRGVRVIAATTYEEFRQYISPNQPLVERLQRINLRQPGKEMTVAILKGMATRYGVENQFYNDGIYEMIYEYTNRYIPASSQPRKSLLILDSMIGWHRAYGRKMDMSLLADVIYESAGVNVTFRVDAKTIKKELDEHVFAQGLATSVIEQRLQIAVADLNDSSKPMSTFLFAGSTGVGKDVLDSEMIPVYTEDGSVFMKRNGDLQVGDYVFNREGKPVEVTGVYPQGIRDIYEVELTDGRVLHVGAGHLWTYKSRFGNGSKCWKVADTATLMQKYQNEYRPTDRNAHTIKFVIPMNQAVAWSEREYKLDPYVMGVAIGNGCLSINAFTISSGDEETIVRCQSLLHAVGMYKNPHNYSYTYLTGKKHGTVNCHYQTKDVLSEVPELIGLTSDKKYIPEIYKRGSIEQRWSLIQGLFDTDGTIDNGNRARVSYSTVSERLAYDVQDVLYSLGISSSVISYDRADKSREYRVSVKCNNDDKVKFFRLERKKKRAEAAQILNQTKERVKKFGEVIGIRDIRKTDRKDSTTCIMVDDEEHLYQAGQYIVTHNTEVTKQLARILFEDTRNLIRFDMTEYANSDSLERFRRERTARVWERPYSSVLLDEIEKSCAEVTRILLQVLDDGRLSDENNREVSFQNCYIILTTNAGSEIFENISQYAVDDTGSGKEMKRYNKLIRRSISQTTGNNRFPPELLGRIDTIVPFQPLSETTMKKIVTNKIMQLKKEVYQKHNVELNVHKRVIQYLVEDNMDTQASSGGARIVMSKLEEEVTTAVARFINLHPDIMRVGVVVKGAMASDDKNRLESEAYIEVGPI